MGLQGPIAIILFGINRDCTSDFRSFMQIFTWPLEFRSRAVSEMASDAAQLRSSRGQVKNFTNDLKLLVQSRFIPNKRMAIGPWSPQNFRSPYCSGLVVYFSFDCLKGSSGTGRGSLHNRYCGGFLSTLHEGTLNDQVRDCTLPVSLGWDTRKFE